MTVTRCAVCRRRLTDPYSVAVGVGPECRGKFPKHHFPRPKWSVSRGKVIFDGLMPVNSTGREKRDDDQEAETEEG